MFSSMLCLHRAWDPLGKQAKASILANESAVPVGDRIWGKVLGAWREGSVWSKTFQERPRLHFKPSLWEVKFQWRNEESTHVSVYVWHRGWSRSKGVYPTETNKGREPEEEQIPERLWFPCFVLFPSPQRCCARIYSVSCSIARLPIKIRFYPRYLSLKTK